MIDPDAIPGTMELVVEFNLPDDCCAGNLKIESGYLFEKNMLADLKENNKQNYFLEKIAINSLRWPQLKQLQSFKQIRKYLSEQNRVSERSELTPF